MKKLIKKVVHINRSYCSFMHIIYTLFPFIASQIYQRDGYKLILNKSDLSNTTYKEYRAKTAYLEFDNDVTEIGDRAFEMWFWLWSVKFPNSLTVIHENAFNWCLALSVIEFGESLQFIEECAFISCSNLKNLEIPNSVVYIGPFAFDGCIKYILLRYILKI